MKSRLVIAFFFISTAFCLSQEINSRGDKFFYTYAYEDAIEAYEKQLQQGEAMSNFQRLNLADSYFKTGEYDKASKIYLDINKNDSIMSDHRFNKMLQSLAKISETDQVKAVLKSKKGTSFAGELLENAEFNDEVLNSDDTESAGFFIFSLNSNSSEADNAPSFYKNDLLFSSSRKTRSKKIYGPSGDAYLDIYKVTKDPNGSLSEASPFGRIPNSEFHKSTPYYSESTGDIYYILSNTEDNNLAFDEKGKNALSIGMVSENGAFRFLLKDLSTSFYYPFYNAESGRLYFSANFEDSYGGTDIYYVDMNNGQVMSQPINLGPRINSPGNEIAPYVFDNSIYFSSDVFYGMGGMDIYRSNLLPDNGFSIPVNLGKGINTKYDEFGFIIKQNQEEGLMGYFSSNRSGGKGGDDIYGFKISEKPGLQTLIFRGKVVKPPYDQSLSDASIKVLDGDGNVLKEVFSGANGAYQLEIPYHPVVTLEVSKETFSRFTETYNPKGLKELEKTPLKIELSSIADIVEEKEGKMVLNLKDFFFVSGQSNLTPDITMEIDKVVDAVKKFPKLKFSIETHTDSRGGRSSNQRISEQRSAAIKAYLLKNGVPSETITSSKGFGEDKIVNNCTDGVYCLDFLHKQNLRTLFVVENYDELSQ
ncbi:OmpA family protein [Pricia antarctica]|uniref:OmpA family protein n=1 Tax=Pricia antarctica TaxID=641691 RepID=A0A1G7AEC1_9FLAO|nr:OmpA family protein [Pricia antarctica]SDE13033.1 OmpA family protein [Pricia antarctica]